MEPIKELADELFREHARRARETSPEEKLMAAHLVPLTWPARSWRTASVISIPTLTRNKSTSCSASDSPLHDVWRNRGEL